MKRCAPNGSGWSACECTHYGTEIAVSPSGSDTAAGTLQAPFRTLERARVKVGQLVSAGLPADGVVVWLREGVHVLDAPLTLGPGQSGDENHPIAWRGFPGETARVMGGRVIGPSAFAPVGPSAPLYGRLDPAARAAVVSTSLPASGITDYGQLVSRGFHGPAARGPLELYVNGEAMTLARWPDRDEDTTVAGLETANELDVYGTLSPAVAGHYVKSGTADGVSAFTRQGTVGGLTYFLYRLTWVFQGTQSTAWFLSTEQGAYPSNQHPWWYRYDTALGTMAPSAGATGNATFQDDDGINHGFASIDEGLTDRTWRYKGNRPSRWASMNDVWFHGYWMYAWADQHLKASAINVATKTVTLASASGYGIDAEQPYYAYNIPEELTSPGEYYLDRSDGTLYFWPPSSLTNTEVAVSMLDSTLVTLQNARFVTLQDFTLELGRSRLVDVIGGDHDRLIGLTLRNTGTDAARVRGHDQLVRSCHVYGTGNGGIDVSAGVRSTLTAGNVIVENSAFHHLSRWEWTVRPAISLDGHGNVARHNEILHLPHTAIMFEGSGHTMELNEIGYVCQFSSDAGGIYGGRDWGARGVVIRHNFIHHMSTWFDGDGIHAIYLDDCLSGVRVEGNVLYKIADFGIEHGGGRDDILVGNVIARSGGALVADRRCATLLSRGVPNNVPGDSWNLLEKLRAVGYQSQPWAQAWPECAAIPDDWNAISSPPSHWLEPEGTVYARNVSWQNDVDRTGTQATFAAYAQLADNLTGVDPQFVDEVNLDLSLSASSPARALPGYVDIPFGDIGIKP